MSKEIVKACVKYNDRLYTGFDHGECFKKLNEDNTIIVHNEIEQGFVDNDGNFVDRKQAMIIAKESGQLRYEPSKKTLISEDLHLNWLNQQADRITELEEQLKNAIVPKFKYGQECYIVCDKNIIKCKIYNISNSRIQYECEFIDNPRYSVCRSSDCVYATKEEAKAKIMNDEYEDIIDTFDMEITEILDIVEDA